MIKSVPVAKTQEADILHVGDEHGLGAVIGERGGEGGREESLDVWELGEVLKEEDGGDVERDEGVEVEIAELGEGCGFEPGELFDSEEGCREV